MPIGVAVLLALALGACVGLINGAFVVIFGIDSFIVTLGHGDVPGRRRPRDQRFRDDHRHLDRPDRPPSSSSGSSASRSRSTTALAVVHRALVPPRVHGARAAAAVRRPEPQRRAAERHPGRPDAVGRARRVGDDRGVGRRALRRHHRRRRPGSGASFLLPAFAAAFLGATSIDPGALQPVGLVRSPSTSS